MSDIFVQAIGRLAGGRVLDVATGRGTFAGLLATHLQGHDCVVAIDTSMWALTAARGDPELQQIRLACIGAERLAFGDGDFDTVAICASLHHLARPEQALAEMMRVLRPGGHLVLMEMHTTTQSEPERVGTQFHQWAASVDMALGINHFPTFPRRQFVDWIETLPLDGVEMYDRDGTDADPFDTDYAAQVQEYLDIYLERARKVPSYPTLEQQAAELHRRLDTDGILPEPTLLIVARKMS
jgi:SAM-dependent methyltransferase